MRLLVKMRPGQGLRSLAFGAAAIEIKAPLMPSVEAGRKRGAAAAPVWHLAEASGEDDANPWELCHQLTGRGLGAADAAIDFAEPDLEQRWISGDRGRQGLALARSCEHAEPQNPAYPPGEEPRWFGGSAFSQLYKACDEIGDPGDAKRLRIAHLDTGYDPQHLTTPRFLSKKLQRNFVDAAFPNDATDRSDDFVNTLGHGTGTIGILAGTWDGKALGGAANLEIVPIRVADLVVLFRNSAIARAFDYVHSLAAGPDRIDVVTLSMGGVPSQAWADAVNALYESGVFIVAAAGNNFGNLPTSEVVYPARFNRVVAACGAMANKDPYADLGLRRMGGNYGPPAKMKTALAAFTPNIPWARFGCVKTVDLDGGGTSSATPQIAAAAALWLQKHRSQVAKYTAPWMRVEAARRALFDKAQAHGSESGKYFGRGLLRAADALTVAPAAEAELTRQPADDVSFPILRLLPGFGAAGAEGERLRMLELEAAQLAGGSKDIQEALGRAEEGKATASLTPEARAVLAALAGDPAASKTLRYRIETALGGRPGSAPGARAAKPAAAQPEGAWREALDPPLPAPGARRLRVYAQDPLTGTKLDTLHLNEATLRVRWEPGLEKGPVGEYLEVVDIDPTNDAAYAPVDLNRPSLLSTDGLAPSEGLPQFHQQMVYAVAMKTIEHFERALGRVALWAPRKIDLPIKNSAKRLRRQHFVRRLRIYPHALREANAYYSPEKKALLFGYFPASVREPGRNLPGGMIFTCLAHDIIAHEVTHALLDGLHPRFGEATNPDMLAFHEAFADIVALMQHFTMPEALKDAIAKTGGDLARQSSLGALAEQFGQAIEGRGALRHAIGKTVRGEWRPHEPSPEDYERSSEPHARGAVLVAAVFDAFLQVYRQRIRSLLQLASGGTGILPKGDIPPVLVDSLAAEAADIADRILDICIRALDYCPPVDLRFGEYLRALITADRDIAPDDPATYRVAFIDAFRSRGIYPTDVHSLSETSLTWEPAQRRFNGLDQTIKEMDLGWKLRTDRREVFVRARRNARRVHEWLVSAQTSETDLRSLGLVKTTEKLHSEEMGEPGYFSKLEVHSVRPARRIAQGRELRVDLVIEVTQKFVPDDRTKPAWRGGCTLIADLADGQVRYVIRKRVDSPKSMAKLHAFKLGLRNSALHGIYFGDAQLRAEPFAVAHRHM